MDKSNLVMPWGEGTIALQTERQGWMSLEDGLVLYNGFDACSSCEYPYFK